ncbi:MAG TPA: RHS repeat-associated core domain-containing protein [Chlorobiota bacterium]|nr:RHS repeat-associated core domain-containing protein [Chlorobiota bacterium]
MTSTILMMVKTDDIDMVNCEIRIIYRTYKPKISVSESYIFEWRYRFGPLQEREQKRQYANANGTLNNGLLWTYTLLGADAKQLMTYNGLQADWCGQPAGTVWIWPVEHNSYGPAQSRIIMRPDGTRNVVITDHLGSTRLTFSTDAAPMQSQLHNAFGEVTSDVGEGARTGYIGREHDVESDLGFYGVRLYVPEYGRFMSTDPLWGMYITLQPYQYAGNSPMGSRDPSGLFIAVTQAETQQIVVQTFERHYGVTPTFSSQGQLQLDQAEVAQARQNLSQELAQQLDELNYMAQDRSKVIDVYSVPNGTNVPTVKLWDQNGIEVESPGLNMVDGPEYVVQLPTAPSNMAIMLNRDLLDAQFNQSGPKTDPCETCVVIHSLLDHGHPWYTLGFSASRIEGVDNHNTALRSVGSGVLRDGSDHNPVSGR